MRCAAAPHGPRRSPVTGPPSAAARLWMQTETACATMPKTAHEPTATVPGLGLGPATLLVMPPEMAMDTVTALAVVMAMAWALAAVTVPAVLIAPALVAPSATERVLAAGLATVQALAVVLALGLTMARVLAVGLVLAPVPGPATVLAALLTTLLARVHIMVGAAGASSAYGRGRRR